MFRLHIILLIMCLYSIPTRISAQDIPFPRFIVNSDASDIDFVGDFRTSEDRDEWALRCGDRIAEVLDFFCDEESDHFWFLPHSKRNCDHGSFFAVAEVRKHSGESPMLAVGRTPSISSR